MSTFPCQTCGCIQGMYYSDREDSHGNPEATDSPVNNKRRSPPSERPPFGPHLTQHHNISAEEQDSPERIIQKEELHAELKRVLSEKRNHLREINSTVTDMEENSKKDSNSEIEKENRLSELVEVVVETQAEVGASGYSVVGGGEQGIFIKDVLKDSPAAKHLSLQKGDQLLSARVYFDNVKYEDAFKILQCAEPYKVSFFLKRTVPESDVSIRLGAQNLELRSPKAKMQRMSVKSVKLFKAKKKRGGRFGLKRLKENKKARAQLDIEGSPGKSMLSPVDVEFVFPKFKMRKGVKATADGSGQLEGMTTSSRKKRKIRFPKMKEMDAAVGDVSTYEGHAEASGAKLKGNAKGAKFGINLPKIKKSKWDAQSSTDNFDVKGSVAKLKPPSTESNLSMHKGKVEVRVSNPDISVKGKAQNPEAKLPEINLDVSNTKMAMPNIKLPKVRLSCNSDEMDGEARKYKMPTGDIKAGNVDLNLGGAELKKGIIPDTNVKGKNISMAKVDTTIKLNLETKQKFGDGSFSLPKPDIAVPNIETSDVDISLPTLEVLIPKVTLEEGKIDVETARIEGGTKLDTLIPKGTIESTQHIDGKGGHFEMAKFDVTLPKMKSSGEIDVKGPEIKAGKFHMTSVDISLAGGGAKGDANIDGQSGKGGKLEMPKLDVSLPKMKSSGEIDVIGTKIKGGKFHMPTIDISLPGAGAKGDINIGGQAGEGGKFEVPKFDVSLPKMKSSGEIDIKGPEVKGGKFHMPSIDIALPGGGAKGDLNIEGQSGKGGKFEMPKLDVSLPKMKSSGEIEVKGPEVKGGKFHMPTIDISLPGGGAEGDVNIEGQTGKGGKLEMPKLDVSLPKMKSSGEIDVKGPEVKGGKFHMPTIDISLPGGGAKGDVNIEGQTGKGGKFEMPKLDVSLPKMKSSGEIDVKSPEDKVSLPKMKSSGEIDVKGPEVKGGKFHMPTIDISLPGGGAKGDVNIEGQAGKGGKFEMPKLDVSFPKMKSSGEIDVKGPEVKGGKFHMPSTDISLPGGGAKGDANIEGQAGKGGQFEMPKLDVSLPKMKSSGEIDIKGPEVKGGKFHMPTIDISLPGGGAKGDANIEGRAGKGGKFEMPKLDVSFPKMKSSGEIDVKGPEVKGGKFHMPSTDISLPGGGAKGDANIEGQAGKGGKLEMPKLDVSLPKIKSSGREINVEGPDIKGGKFHMPSIDFSLSGGGAKGDVNIEGHAGKGGTFEMPKLDISLPKMKSSGEIDVKGPEVKGGKFHMPTIDISLPGGGEGAKRYVNIEGQEGKGGKFGMPKLDVSLPKLKSSSGEIDVKGHEVKGGKFHMPSIDISLPGGGEKGDVNIEGQAGKGAKFVDLSLPKMKLKELKFERQDKKGRKFHIPDIDISMPKISHNFDTDANATGTKISDPEVTVGGNIKLPTVKIPTVDISAPKVDLDFIYPKGKDSDRENIELLKAEGGRPSSGTSFDIPDVSFKMPKILLPKFGRKLKSGEKEQGSPASADLDMEGKLPSMEIDGTIKKTPIKMAPKKGKIKDAEMEMSLETLENKGKLKLPAIEISLPTSNIPEYEVLLPKAEVDVSESDIRSYEGSLKIPKMPTIDISVPKVDLDVSLSKVKLDESMDSNSSDLNIESSRGVVHFPNIKIPKVDISLPRVKSGGTENVEVEGKGSKIKLPKIPAVDISLPKGKTDQNNPHEPEAGGVGHFSVTGVKIPNVDIKMATVDISPPKIKPKDIIAPDVQTSEGECKGTTPGIKLPKVDISLPQGKTGNISPAELKLSGEAGKFRMPNINVPKVEMTLSHEKTGDIKTPEIEFRAKGEKFKMPDIKTPTMDISLPHGKAGDLDINILKADASIPTTDSGLKITGLPKEGKKMRMPAIDIVAPKGDLELDLGLLKEGEKNKKMPEVQNIELSPDESKVKVKGEKVKGSKFNIGMPKFKVSRSEGDVTKSVKEDPKSSKGGTDANLKVGVQAQESSLNMSKMKLPDVEMTGPKRLITPKIPELDFDIEPVQVDTNNEEDRKQTSKVKIPKFGIPLPSLVSPEASLTSQVKGDSVSMHSEVEYEGPSMPKVRKAVFVMVNQQIESTALVCHEASFGIGDEKLKLPKIELKPSVSKSPSNEKGKSISDQEEVEKGKTGKLKMPNVTFSSAKTGLFDVTLSESDDVRSPNLNDDKDDKGKFAKVKMPKEFFSPYSKDKVEEEETSMKLRKETSWDVKETQSGKMSFSGVKKTTETHEGKGEVSVLVSSKARTEMLEERESSESPIPSAGFFSVSKSEERGETTWFKVPKVTLSPHTGFLQITPEGSPKGSRSSLPCSGEEASGGFYVKIPSIEFLTHEMSSEQLVTKTKGTRTVVTKTTKYTETKSSSSNL
ncbi:putative periaxin [Triplophysa rosa]|uniref:Periaxin n=1 Tax=Triplophysa rosa TaxID=992332 RepID=A0A9W7WJV6_TRIRA|nr:putative periaxin [Triplophysa rosa]